VIESLRKVMSQKVLIALNPSQSNGVSSVIVYEDGELSDIKELTIKEVPDDSLAFTLDFSSKKNDLRDKSHYGQLSPYLDKSNGDGINKSCDLIIVTRKNDDFTVLLFDQKSSKPDIERCHLQLENSRVFFQYLLNLISLVYEEKIASDQVAFRKVIGTTRTVKGFVNAGADPERARRDELKKLGIKEISIKKLPSPDKGWLDWRGMTI